MNNKGKESVNQNSSEIMQKKYRQLCQESSEKIPIRLDVLEHIKKKKIEKFDLSDILEIGETELLLLLSLFKFKSWKFSNARILNPISFFDLLSKNQEIQEVTLFHYASNVEMPHLLINLLESFKKIERICLSKILPSKKIRALYVPTLGIRNPENIKILKMKQCNLEDSFLPFL